MKAIVAQGTSATVYADSAIGRDCEPLFIPDGEGWSAQICPAVRIGRLGRHIAEKFADRYAESVSMVILLTTTDAEAARMLPLTDSAITAGQWHEPSTAGTLEIKVSNLKTQQTIEERITEIELNYTPIISQISNYATLKTGDILVLGDRGTALDLEPNTRVHVSLDGQVCLNLKIK